MLPNEIFYNLNLLNFEIENHASNFDMVTAILNVWDEEVLNHGAIRDDLLALTQAGIKE